MKIFHCLIDKKMMKRYEKTPISAKGFHLFFETEPSLRATTTDESFYLHLGESGIKQYLPWMQYLIDAAQTNTEEYRTIYKYLTISFILKLSDLLDKQFNYAVNDKNTTLLRCLALSIDYMHQHIGERITIEELAHASMLSRSWYMKQFSQIFHCSPFRYLQKMRVRKASDLLCTTDLSISSIAQECGFFDNSHLTSTFKSETGKTPSEFRKEVIINP